MSGEAFRARWDGAALHPLTRKELGLTAGEVLHVTVERERSEASHRQQFAWLRQAWESLPEVDLFQPWAETPETLRKHALIATGFASVSATDVGTNLAAHRIKALLLTHATAAHGYAVATVKGPIVTLYVPESQSHRAMGADRFQLSKTKILDWIANRIGVAPEELAKQGESA